MWFGTEITHDLNMFLVLLIVNPKQILNGQYSVVTAGMGDAGTWLM